MPSQRYDTLDALRGIAALVVVGFHLGQVKLEPAVFPYGYLAVDFFFVLSGFVVAHAYERPLCAGLPWSVFYAKRMIRIYPLALLGALMGLVVLLLKWHAAPGKVDPLPQILASGFLNSLMLPTVFGADVSRHELFPGNGPLWTLFFEMVANMVWAAIGARLKTRTLVLVTAACGLLLVGFDWRFHTANIGFDVATFWGGFARVGFGFSLGVVLFRLLPKLRIPASPAGPFALGLVLLCVLAFPRVPVTDGIPWYALLCTFLILPGIVVLGIGQVTSGAAGAFVGRLSYPVYVLHFPIVLTASALHQSVLAKVNVHLLAAASVALTLALALGALAFYDAPIRRRLLGMLARGTETQAGARIRSAG